MKDKNIIRNDKKYVRIRLFNSLNFNINNKFSIVTLFSIFMIIILLMSFVSAGIIAQLGMQGLSFVDPSAGQAVNSIVNVALCVANPPLCAAQKITSIIAESFITEINKLDPNLGKIVSYYNKLKPLIDSKDVTIKEDLEFDDNGLVSKGILQIENGKETDITNFFDNDKNTFLASNLRAEKTKDGVTILSFNRENSYLSIIDKITNKKIDFINIVASDKGDSYLSLDQYGNIFSASFLVNDKGGEYNFNENIVKAPPNTRVKYTKGIIARPSKIGLDVPDGETLSEAPIVKDGVVEINGKNIKLPDGNVLNEGTLSYSSEGAYIAEGAKTRINGDLIEAYGNDVCLFKCNKGNYVLFGQGAEKNVLHVEGNNYKIFSSLGVSTQVSDKNELNNIISLPTKGYFQVGDKSKWINDYFGVSGEGYSKDTYNQVIKFQHANNLKEDGLVGKETLARMYGFPNLQLPSKGYFDVGNLPIEFKSMLGVSNQFDKSQIEAVIKDYQSRNKLYSDGLVGKNTLEKLRNDFISGKLNYYADNILLGPKNSVVDFVNNLNGVNVMPLSGSGKITLGKWDYDYQFSSKNILVQQGIFPSIGDKTFVPSTILVNNKAGNLQQIRMSTDLNGGIKNIEVDPNLLQTTIDKAYSNDYYKTPGMCGANFICTLTNSFNLDQTQVKQLLGSTSGFDAKKLPSKIISSGGYALSFDQVNVGDAIFFDNNHHVALITKVIYDSRGDVNDIEFTHQLGNHNNGKMQIDTLSKFSQKYPNYKPNQYMRLNWASIGGEPETHLVAQNIVSSDSISGG